MCAQPAASLPGVNLLSMSKLIFHRSLGTHFPRKEDKNGILPIQATAHSYLMMHFHERLRNNKAMTNAGR